MGNSNDFERRELGTWELLRQRACSEPHLVLMGIISLVNGYWHKVKFFLTGKRITVGKGFRVYGRFIVLGPGEVSIGDNSFVQSKLFKPTTFFTALPTAKIVIGNNTGFSGTTLQCYKSIKVDDWCNIANAYIVDSPGHFLSADRRHLPSSTLPTFPVHIKRNVWISANVVICHGVSIGENSVVGACSLVRKSIPDNSFVAGNPSEFIKKIPASHAELK